ncbi:MAG TPA: hypothetical protein DCQ64_18295 [Candidatus Rokubacteria bacterium]|nr:hypothetical protein [Candidatus Rokubacteria bacterium]
MNIDLARKTESRAALAYERLYLLRDCPPEHFASRMDSWLQVATGGEVRRGWRRTWGEMPGWAL